MKIVIPTYLRSDTISKKTLTTLKQEGFLASDITLFVANQQEADLYKQKVPANLYSDIVVGLKGISAQRNFISSYYPEGTHLLFIDDDIRGFKRKQGFESVHLPTLFDDLFTYCNQNNSYLFGLYPACNELYLKPRVRHGIHLVCGSCFGFINNHSIFSPPNLQCKVDYALSISAYNLTNNLIRADFVSPITSYWKSKGGLVSERTFESEMACAREIYYGNLNLIDKLWVKKNGRPDIAFSRKIPKKYCPVEVGNDARILFSQTQT